MITVHRRWLLGAAAGALGGVAAGWVLAAPEASSWARAVSLCAGATVLGAAVLAVMVRGERRPDVAAADLWRLIAVLGGVWLLGETVQLVADAAASVDAPVARLGVADLTGYLGAVGAGRVAVAAWLCVAACTIAAAVVYRRDPHLSTTPILVVAALALIARPVSGHMSQQPLGSLLDAVHVLAAATWFGVLAALAVLVRSRGAWARLLPRYATSAGRCVIAVAVTGVVDAAVRLGSVAALVDTGYGRVVLAKTAMLLVLLALAWWWRRSWVPAATAHRASAEVSLRNAVIEVCAMSVAFGLAAALATSA